MKHHAFVAVLMHISAQNLKSGVELHCKIYNIDELLATEMNFSPLSTRRYEHTTLEPQRKICTASETLKHALLM